MMRELAKVEAGKNLGNLPGLVKTAGVEVKALEAGVKNLATAVNTANTAIQAIKAGKAPKTGDKDIDQGAQNVIDAQPAPTPRTSALMPAGGAGPAGFGGPAAGAGSPKPFGGGPLTSVSVRNNKKSRKCRPAWLIARTYH